MSGTAVAVAEQLWEFYELKVGAIPTNFSCIRQDEPDRLYVTVAEKETAIVEYVAGVHATGRPILLGTLNVAESERLAGKLADVGVEGVVLNAKNDAEEAAIVARAGEYGRVTISTQMAGRGTDIRLGVVDGVGRERVVALGGLCVVGSGRLPHRPARRPIAGPRRPPGRSRRVSVLHQPAGRVGHPARAGGRGTHPGR
jgi:preprotein translocase subunit SecA